MEGRGLWPAQASLPSCSTHFTRPPICFISFSSAQPSDQLPATREGTGLPEAMLGWDRIPADSFGKLQVAASHRSWEALAPTVGKQEVAWHPHLTKSTAPCIMTPSSGSRTRGSMFPHLCPHWCQQTKLSIDSPWRQPPGSLSLSHAHQLHGLCRKNICSASFCEAKRTAGCLKEDLSTLSISPWWFLPETPRVEYVLEQPVCPLQYGAGWPSRIVSGPQAWPPQWHTISIFVLKIR